MHRGVHAGRDPLALFVGVEAYERASGFVRRDPFGEEGDGYMTERGLFEWLAAAKLGALAEEVRAEGWAWVDILLHSSYETLYRFAHCAKAKRKPTPDEQAALDAAAAEVSELQQGFPAPCATAPGRRVQRTLRCPQVHGTTRRARSAAGLGTVRVPGARGQAVGLWATPGSMRRTAMPMSAGQHGFRRHRTAS